MNKTDKDLFREYLKIIIQREGEDWSMNLICDMLTIFSTLVTVLGLTMGKDKAFPAIDNCFNVTFQDKRQIIDQLEPLIKGNIERWGEVMKARTVKYIM